MIQCRFNLTSIRNGGDQVNSFFKRHKAAGAGESSSSFIGGSGQVLQSELTKLLGSIWAKERIPKFCSALVIVPIYKKDGRFSYVDHKGISLVDTGSKLLVGIILCFLSVTLEGCVLENQADFRPGWSCIEKIFTL